MEGAPLGEAIPSRGRSRVRDEIFVGESKVPGRVRRCLLSALVRKKQAPVLSKRPEGRVRL